jgi:hypothetical protein
VSRLRTPRFYQRAGHITSQVVVTPDDADATSSTNPGGGLTQGDYGLEPNTRVVTPLRALFLVGAVAFASFWFWALFLIDKTAINKIEDRAWTERAEAICEPVKLSVRRLDLQTSAGLDGRADLVVQSTDMMAAMLDDLIAVEPADAKGQAIIPDWIADYRTLLQDRYNYADRLRNGENVPYTETPVQGVPITERLETFAGDNEMSSCAPPRRGVLN